MKGRARHWRSSAPLPPHGQSPDRSPRARGAAQRILRTKTVARGGCEGAVWAPSHTHGGAIPQRILRTKTVARGGREGAVWAPSHTHGGAMGAKKARATLGAGNPTGRGKSCCFSVKILKPSSPNTCFGGVPYMIGSPSRKRGVPIKIEGLPRPPRAPGVRQQGRCARSSHCA